MESFSGKFYGLEKTFSERDSTIFIYYELHWLDSLLTLCCVHLF